MKRRSEENWDELRERIIGLGEESLRKSYYPELQKKLAELERFTGLLNQSRDSIFLIQSPGGRMVDANLTACRLTGYSLEQLQGLSFGSLFDAGSWQSLAPLIDGQGKPGSELICAELQTASGRQVPVEISLQLDNFGTGTFAIAVARNISDRLLAEEEKRQLEHQLAQVQKMDSIGRLAGGVAHDFNNILSVIMGSTEILQCGAGNWSADDRELLEEIMKAVERARDLTRQLLAFSRKQVLALKPVNLNEVVRGFDKMLGRLIGEDIERKTVLDPNLAPVTADETQIEQIILNLAVNARDAMAGGGRLTIETGNVVIDEHFIRLADGVKPGRYAMLAVSDTGTGMDRATLAHAWEPFFTTKGKGKGTGLGLSTVYGIVKQHGGHVWAASEVGHGTTFKVYLPQSSQEARPPAAPAAAREALACPVKVLLLEDDPWMRDMVTTMLRSLGCLVHVAGGSQEAVRLAGAEGPFDLLLTDVVMPGLSGRQVYDQIAAAQKSIRVLFMSGYTSEVITRHGVLAAGVHFLQKPFTIRDLAQKIRETMAGG